MRDWFRQINLIVVAVVLFSTAAFFLIFSFHFSLFGADDRTYTAIGATLAGVVTFTLNAIAQNRRSRTQHTIKILFDTRISQEFRIRLERRAEHFTPGSVVDAERYFAWLNASSAVRRDSGEAQRKYESADALRSLLNYYEFIAVGIRTGDLDERLLRKTIRGIMCSLVADCRPIVLAEQSRNPLSYENLAWLYAQWRKGEPALKG